MKLQHSALTDIGKTRQVNQDSIGVSPVLSDGSQLFVVCDGMGGHLSGEIASQTAIETILKAFPADAAQDFPKALSETFQHANMAVFERGRGNMGTTAVALLLYKNFAFIANVGDSRAYLLRNGEFRQVTVDHSFVEEQVRAGLMTREQAYYSNVKNIITRAVGHQRDMNVDVFREQTEPGDVFLLSSDGLHGYVEESVIIDVLRNTPFDQITPKLISLANAAGGLDNISTIVVKVVEVDAVAENDPLLQHLLASSYITQAFHTADDDEPTFPPGTLQVPQDVALPPPQRGTTRLMAPQGMMDDPTMENIAPAPVNVAAPGVRPPLAPRPAQDQKSSSSWGCLGALITLALLAFALYWFDLPPMSMLFSRNAPTAVTNELPSLMPTTTLPNNISTTIPLTDTPGLTPSDVTPEVSPEPTLIMTPTP